MRRHWFEPKGERISRLPDVEGDTPVRKKFKRYPIGSFHVDSAGVQTAEGKLSLFVAIDRTPRFAFAQLRRSAGKREAAQFLRDPVAAVPYAIHTVLTDRAIGVPSVRETMARGIQLTNPACDVSAVYHIFDRVCDGNGIEHRLTKVKHPWSHEDQKTIRGDCFSEGRSGRAHEPRDQGSDRQTLP